jgi:hypothetical protein
MIRNFRNKTMILRRNQDVKKIEKKRKEAQENSDKNKKKEAKDELK